MWRTPWDSLLCAKTHTASPCSCALSLLRAARARRRSSGCGPTAARGGRRRARFSPNCAAQRTIASIWQMMRRPPWPCERSFSERGDSCLPAALSADRLPTSGPPWSLKTQLARRGGGPERRRDGRQHISKSGPVHAGWGFDSPLRHHLLGCTGPFSPTISTLLLCRQVARGARFADICRPRVRLFLL
jgi:hypothetical protein